MRGVLEDPQKSDNSLPISSKVKRTSLRSLLSRLGNVILFYKVCFFKMASFNVFVTSIGISSNKFTPRYTQ